MHVRIYAILCVSTCIDNLCVGVCLYASMCTWVELTSAQLMTFHLLAGYKQVNYGCHLTAINANQPQKVHKEANVMFPC